MNGRIRALVVDDSSVYRILVSRALRTFPDVELVGTARNGRDCLDVIQVQAPDLVTMDFEMPEMDGMQALREVVRRNASLPADRRSRVVMLSSHSKAGADLTIEALHAGAYDFLAKQSEGTPEENFEKLRAELGRIIDGIRQEIGVRSSGAIARPVSRHTPMSATSTTRPSSASSKPLGSQPPSAPLRPGALKKPQAIVIGVSTGGPVALSSMLPELTKVVDLPILVVQHMPPKFTQSLAESLARKCRHKVVEASHGERVFSNELYIAPGGHHMEVVKGNGGFQIQLHDQPPENGCRPAVDVLFRSAAEAYDGHVLAMVLTGMGSDGSLGLRPLREKGAAVIVQDKESSVVWGMPGSAWHAGLADLMVPLMDIPAAIKRYL